MRELERVQSVLIELDGNRYRLRKNMLGTSLHAFNAAGAKPPATITQLS